jgi:hypothetical protein
MVALFGLLMVKVSVEMSPVPTAAGEKVFAINGGTAGCTTKVLLAVRPVEVTALLVVATVPVVFA